MTKKEQLEKLIETLKEFDCRECGRHIYSIGNQLLQEKHGDICAACWSLGRWWDDPELAEKIDPEYKRDPKC